MQDEDFDMYSHLMHHVEQNMTFTFEFHVHSHSTKCTSMNMHISQTIGCRKFIFIYTRHK